MQTSEAETDPDGSSAKGSGDRWFPAVAAALSKPSSLKFKRSPLTSPETELESSSSGQNGCGWKRWFDSSGEMHTCMPIVNTNPNKVT